MTIVAEGIGVPPVYSSMLDRFGPSCSRIGSSRSGAAFQSRQWRLVVVALDHGSEAVEPILVSLGKRHNSKNSSEGCYGQREPAQVRPVRVDDGGEQRRLVSAHAVPHPGQKVVVGQFGRAVVVCRGSRVWARHFAPVVEGYDDKPH